MVMKKERRVKTNSRHCSSRSAHRARRFTGEMSRTALFLSFELDKNQIEKKGREEFTRKKIRDVRGKEGVIRLFLSYATSQLLNHAVQLSETFLGVQNRFLRRSTNGLHEVLVWIVVEARCLLLVFAPLHGLVPKGRGCDGLRVLLAGLHVRCVAQLANIAIDDQTKILDHFHVVHDVFALLLVGLLNAFEVLDHVRAFLDPLIVIVKDLHEIRVALVGGEANVFLLELLEILSTTKMRIALQTIVRAQQTILKGNRTFVLLAVNASLTLRKLSFRSLMSFRCLSARATHRR